MVIKDPNFYRYRESKQTVERPMSVGAGPTVGEFYKVSNEIENLKINMSSADGEVESPDKSFKLDDSPSFKL
jgi:hypothetical protein